jgi:hypothetical protein
MKCLTINRFHENEVQTLGELLLKENDAFLFKCATLELPWRDNERNISRIPSGKYEGILHHSPKFGKCVWIKNVPDRSEILIHKGNFYTNTLGCPLVGRYHKDINNDRHKDVVDSANTMKDLLNYLKEDEVIRIKIVDNL